MSKPAWFWEARAGALVSLVGLAAAVRLRDRLLAVAAVVAALAFPGAAAFFGWAFIVALVAVGVGL